MNPLIRPFLFLLSFIALVSIPVLADTPTRYVGDIAVTGASATISSGTFSEFMVTLNIQNVSESQGAVVSVKGQENVTTIIVLVNGTSCGSATVGLFDAYPFNCNTAVTTAVLQGVANVTLRNNGSNPITLGAIMAVRYRENTPVTDTSNLATSAQLISVNDTVKSEAFTTRQNLTLQINNTNATIQNIKTNVTAIKADTTSIINTLSTLVSDIWNSATRTLTEIKQSIIKLS